MAQISASQTIGLATAPGQRLLPAAAASWDAAARACQAKYGWTPTLTDSFRPLDVQERIFRQRYRQGNHAGARGFTSDVRHWDGQPWTRLTGTAAAAVPGTSNHGGGVAVDAGHAGQSFATFTDTHRKQFMGIAADYGWTDTEGRRVNEPWHLDYEQAKDKHRGTPPASAPAASGTLRQGDHGARVKALQEGLNHAFPAYSKLTPDGSFGPATVKVVETFQTRAGLKPDGVVGPATIAALAKNGVRV